MKTICIFCGSSPGNDPVYAQAAQLTGATLAREGFRVVYGGGSVGLMGEVADAALAEGGEVIGVIPTGLNDKERAHSGLTELHVVGSMHERKAMMADLADGFMALPGGMGTLEEFAEIFTWAQLGIHKKPCGLLNVEGYFDPLISYFDHAVAEGFLWEDHRRIILSGDSPDDLIAQLRAYDPPAVKQWIDESET
ncbi:TIGR00730 family Rossman fold protein [Persicimonas caeni]|uniref:Cytokinin riboside 5'-monophosphate phosphoribohydrolase n=1 Tax=Persicimonas caeni TaxID=2292766 RepID=A0A4Y6PUV5_PERCE|nr:TIGR00730 family Rossman fold protein [Persicimonas caeni]QDG51535.1 TIGR00730 family Rossman fold protein [Persicimonas caeni]QED32756.1 TIGR00730 family Rossman fold protein [Persicimonas caeni]